jgi:hypothetical protein
VRIGRGQGKAGLGARSGAGGRGVAEGGVQVGQKTIFTSLREVGVKYRRIRLEDLGRDPDVRWAEG